MDSATTLENIREWLRKAKQVNRDAVELSTKLADLQIINRSDLTAIPGFDDRFGFPFPLESLAADASTVESFVEAVTRHLESLPITERVRLILCRTMACRFSIVSLETSLKTLGVTEGTLGRVDRIVAKELRITTKFHEVLELVTGQHKVPPTVGDLAALVESGFKGTRLSTT